MPNLSKEKLLIIIALSLAGISLTVSIVLGLQVIKLKQDLTHQSFPTPTPSVTPSLMPSGITPPTPTSVNPNKYFTNESYCEKDSDCTTRPSCCNPCYKDYVNIYHKNPMPKDQCKTRCKQDCPSPDTFGPPVCRNNKCASLASTPSISFSQLWQKRNELLGQQVIVRGSVRFIDALSQGCASPEESPCGGLTRMILFQ